MSAMTDTGYITGTKDRDYDLTWYVESCLDNALRMETYIHDAEQEGDPELIELFTKAQADSRKGAEIGKRLLAARLARSVAAQPMTDTGQTTEASAHEAPTDVMATHRPEE